MSQPDSHSLTRQRLYDLTRLVSDWLWETDREGRFTHASDRVFEILGRPAQALLGKTFADLGRFPDGGDFDSPFRDRRFEATDHGGGIHYLLISGLPVFHPESGEHLGTRGTAKDVTAERRADAEIQRQRSFQQSVLDAIPLPVFIKGAEGRYEICNQAFLDANNKRRSEVIGLSMFDLLPDEEAQRHAREEAILLTEGRTRVWESTSHFADGKTRSVLVTASPQTELMGGHDKGLIGVVLDVTRGKEVENTLRATVAELTETNNDLQRFAEVAAHDLQEPVRAVVSYCQLLDRTLKDRLDEQEREYMSFAIDGAKRMRALVQDLLAYFSAGTEELEVESVPVLDLVEEAINELRSEMERLEGTFEVGDLPETRGRRKELANLFRNLLGNAVKFRSPLRPPEISVKAQPLWDGSGTWRFSIRDNGIGMDPAHAEKVFSIFRRLHGSRSYEGTGVGLAICKRVVTQHGGTIWIESSLDNGCTVHFTLSADQKASGMS
ncbi:MAG: PAS domain-containing protein [Rhodospirillum sp.]|nr:PAS domain-containing protein [Rhodospirillum sp.]MCF8487599.1 PAS domain-containing protein [Rhodospirillum sp.]MCF8500254.1 PAS domain-containing protein [Rhodospirillum sp.]